VQLKKKKLTICKRYVFPSDVILNFAPLQTASGFLSVRQFRVSLVRVENLSLDLL